MASADDFLSLAKHLVDSDPCEEQHFRGVAHSAYYAVYHLVCDHYGLDPEKDWDRANHKEILSKLVMDQKDPPAHIIAAKRSFGTLRRLRVKADYQLKTKFTDTEADDAYARAEEIFSKKS